MLSWQIGSVRVTAVEESVSPTSPRFLFRGVTRENVLERARATPWLAPHFVDDEGYLKLAIQCFVVETPTTVIAVDTCIGNDKVRSNPGWSGLDTPFLDRLAESGYPPERVDLVVCTHLHVDHVGWNTRLVGGHWVATFPNARYLFVDREWEHWKVTPDASGDDYVGDSVAPIVEAGLADLVAPDHVLCAEVRLEPTHGHTPGHVSVRIDSDGAGAVITGDMTHSPLQIADPDLSSQFDSDADAARRCRHESFARWSAADALVIGTHFAPPTAGRLRRPASGNGWVLDT